MDKRPNEWIIIYFCIRTQSACFMNFIYVIELNYQHVLYNQKIAALISIHDWE